MKTAESWWHDLNKPNTQVAIVCVPDISAIQADARQDLEERIAQLEQALPVIQDMLRGAMNQTHIISEPIIRMAIDRIQALATGKETASHE